MLKLSFVAEFDDRAHLEREFEANLKNGGLFVASAGGADRDDACVVELVHPDGEDSLELAARVVFVGDEGIGVEFTGFDAELRERLEGFIKGAGEPATEPEARGPNKGDTVHERLRGLSMADAHKVAREGDASERVVLERIYGKAVWEPLLRNPRLTVPEVSRIARMGALPIPLLELIVSNGSWVNSPTIRRALLGNPKLVGELMLKVLRTTPRHELKLIPRQTVYSPAIKAAARKLLGI